MKRLLNELSIAEAARLLETREIRAVDLARACMNRIAERNAQVGAFVAHDPERVLHEAGRVDAGRRGGVLTGIPFAVKDIIETADYPTAFGSGIYAGYRTARDAGCVAKSREEGAVLLGKVVTSEFATQTPGPVRNPLRLSHTPGGSSSGSAAAVADDMVPAAWGTQTTGSITRPAIYCGVVGYKPSFGMISTAGVHALSPQQDTVGILARTVADTATFAFGMHGARLASPPVARTLRLGVCLSDQWASACASAIQALERFVERAAAAGTSIRHVRLPADLEALIDDQGKIVAYEAAHALAHERQVHAAALSDRILARMQGGDEISLAQYLAMLRRAQRGRQAASALFADVDAIVYPATEGEAEVGLSNSGSPRFGALWTLLHLPTVAFPVDAGPTGMPLGVQLVGAFGSDIELLAAAHQASTFADWRR